MALPGNDNEETLIWKLIARTEDAIKGVEEFRAKVDALKAELKAINAETKESFSTIAASIRKNFKDSIDASKASIRELNQELKNLNAVAKTQAKDIKLSTPAADPAAFAKTNQEIAETNAKLAEQKSILNSTQQAYKQFQSVAPTALKELNAETKAASVGTKAFGLDLSNLNSVARIVFGVTLFSNAGQALRSLIGWFKEVGTEAKDLLQSMFQLEVGVRALRRAGIDVTSSEILENLQKINKETGNLFSNFELIKGAADFTNLIRDLGLTREEIFKLQAAVVQLAIINGRSLADVQRTVALALSSGYTEGLQRLGVSINRLTIAEEANRLGFEGGYTALTEQQRATATYNLLLQKTSKYSNDLSEAQNRLFGQLKNVEAQTTDVSVAIGEKWLPVQLRLNQAVLFFLKLLNVSPIFVFADAVSNLSLAVRSIPAILENAGKGADTFAEKIVRITDLFKGLLDVVSNKKPFKDWIAELANLPTFGEGEVTLGTPEFNADLDRLTNVLEQYGSDVTNLEQDIADKREKIERDLQDDLAKIELDGARDRYDIAQDFLRDLEKINRDGAERLAKLGRDLQDKLQTINLKLDFDINQSKIKFDFDVSETFIKYNQDIAKANEDFRQKEIKRERDYQEKLKQIREDYLLSLEDALEQRDARAVLRARREYILERDRAKRQNDINKQENLEALEEDKKAAVQRREERLRQLRFELEQRQAELRRQAEFDRQQALRNYAQDVQDLQNSIEQQRKERAIQFEQQLQDQALQEAQKREDRLKSYVQEIADLQKYEKDKLTILGKAIAEQAKLAQLGAEEVLKVINAYFGEGGLALQVFKAYLEALQQLTANFSGSFSGVDPSKFNIQSIPGLASGGGIVANKPTTVQFGEVPELALFAPLNQLDKLSNLFSNVGAGKGANGRTEVKIALEPGLVGQIVDQSSDAVADIFFERARVR